MFVSVVAHDCVIDGLWVRVGRVVTCVCSRVQERAS
jgi:hypothetical protein